MASLPQFFQLSRLFSCGPKSALLYRPHQRFKRGLFRRSSVVEQLTVNQFVVGSIPTAGASIPQISEFSAIACSPPRHNRNWLKTKGFPQRIRRASRAITASEAPYLARGPLCLSPEYRTRNRWPTLARNVLARHHRDQPPEVRVRNWVLGFNAAIFCTTVLSGPYAEGLALLKSHLGFGRRQGWQGILPIIIELREQLKNLGARGFAHGAHCRL